MIYCFDLDQTLIETSGGNYADSKPIQYRIDKVNELAKRGDTIIIQTARGKHWYDFTKNQLLRFNINYHLLSVGDKIYADFYIDDKGYNDKTFFD